MSETLATRKPAGQSKFDAGHPLLEAWEAIQAEEPAHHQQAMMGKLGPTAKADAEKFEAKLHAAAKAWREA